LLVRDREAQQHRLGRGKRAAMLVAALRTIIRFHHQRLRLSIDGRAAELDTALLFVGNNDYRLAVPGPGTRDSLDDGKLCLFVLRSKSRAGFLAAVLRALTGRSRADDIVRVDNVGRLLVDSRRSKLAVSVDGEVRHLAPPLAYEIRPAALRVIAEVPTQTRKAR
jgi:diacylglycerol kinase family enzyme